MVHSKLKIKGGAGGGGADDDEPELSDDQARAEVELLETQIEAEANNKGIQRRHIPPKLNAITPTTIDSFKKDISARTEFIRFIMRKIQEVDIELSGWLIARNTEEIANSKQRKLQLQTILRQKKLELDKILDDYKKYAEQMIIDEPKDNNNKILLLLRKFLKYINDKISYIKTILSEFFGKKKIDGGRTRRRNARSSKKSKKSRTKKYRR